MSDAKELNYDLIHCAMSQIQVAQNDMMRCLHQGEVSDVVRERMCAFLRNAADDLEKLRLKHDQAS